MTDHKFNKNFWAKGNKYCECCKGSTNTLTTDCPEEEQCHTALVRIATGTLDYINGEWVSKDEAGKAKDLY